jgi:uncharacterized membrane protein
MPAALTAHAEVLPRSLLAIMALLIAPGTPVLAATYTIIDVPGANYTHAAAINNHGVIAGDSSLFGGHGFLRAADGAFTFFEIKDSTSTTVANLNDSGWVVGSYQDADYASHGFIRKFNGRIIKISDRSGDVGVRGINKPGEVCGYINDSAFVRSSNGTITKFDPPGSLFAVARSINDSGSSTGDFSDPTHSHGFVRASDGTITAFDPPGAADTFSFSINANGAITGWFSDNEGLQHGYVRDLAGQFTVFDVDGQLYTQPMQINSRGVVVGSFADGQFVRHGFLRKQSGNIKTFDPPGQIGTYLMSINGVGAIVGSFDDGLGIHGFLRTP